MAYIQRDIWRKKNRGAFSKQTLRAGMHERDKEDKYLVRD